jgi:hypothetical protein
MFLSRLSFRENSDCFGGIRGNKLNFDHPNSTPAVSRNALAVLIFAASLIAQLAVVCFVAAAWGPDFYQNRLTVSQYALAVHGAAFEEKMQALHTDASDDDGVWSVELSDEQINGWLAVELPRRYPRSLPNQLREPRVAIDAECCHVACQYRNGATSAILTLCLDLQPSERPNELKLKVLSAKIGSVPGLEHQAVGPIAQAARRSKIRLRWVSRDVQPEVLVQIPRRWLEEDRQVHVERINFTDGHLLVSGKSSKRPPRPQPRNGRVAQGNSRRNSQ